jgi:hypothetical protein
LEESEEQSERQNGEEMDSNIYDGESAQVEELPSEW